MLVLVVLFHLFDCVGEDEKVGLVRNSAAEHFHAVLGALLREALDGAGLGLLHRVHYLELAAKLGRNDHVGAVALDEPIFEDFTSFIYLQCQVISVINFICKM